MQKQTEIINLIWKNNWICILYNSTKEENLWNVILTSLVGKIDVVVVILDVLRFWSELCTTAASMVFSLLAKLHYISGTLNH